MSSRRCNDTHTKQVSNSFSIEALIAKDPKNADEEEKKELEPPVRSRNNFEEERTDGKRKTSSVEPDLERTNRITHPNEIGSPSPPRNLPGRHLGPNMGRLNRTQPGESGTPSRSGTPSPRKLPGRDEDDDDCEGVEASRQRSSEGRRDCVKPPVSDNRPQCQQHPHHFPHHLQQFHQLLNRPVHSVMDAVHPLIRQNFLAASNSSRLSASDAGLRRPSGSAAVASSNPLFCCPTPQLSQGPGVVSSAHQRPGASREDELVPFYSWLLSRHGAFFNHRIHPAGITICETHWLTK